MRKLVLTAALTLACSNANAMDYSYHIDYINKKIIIDASGEIFINEVDAYGAWIQDVWPNMGGYTVGAMVFDSPGGNIGGAIKFAQDVTEYNRFNTGVTIYGKCASACTILWAAGRRRSVADDYQIGVHQASLNGLGADEQENSADSKETTFATGRMQLFLETRGAPKSIFIDISDTKPRDVYWVSPFELAEWQTIPIENRPKF